MTHDCGHMVYVFRTWLIVISHGFQACDPVRAHDFIREMSERGPTWSWMLLVHQGGSWSPWSTRSTPIRSDPHFWKFYRKCGSVWIRVDQEDPGDHKPPWWTRSGFYILLMLFYGFWLVPGYGAGDSYESADRFHTMTHYESWVAWREGMSHTGLRLREEPLYKGTLGAEDLGSSRNHLSSFIHYTFNTKDLYLPRFQESRPDGLIWA